jgi:hypothetical protein
MELSEFISSTLQEISRGILDASEKLSDTNAVVSPLDFRINSKDSQAFGRTRNPHFPLNEDEENTRVVQKVDFDIAVSVDESENSQASGKITVLSIGIGAAVDSTTKSGTVSRINFSVPVVLPSVEI